MASTQAKPVFNADQLQELEFLFKKYDKDEDNRVDLGELFELIKSTGEKVSEDDVEAAITSCDMNEDGALNFEEFMTLMVKLKSLD
ncbi:hypothetical protein BGZ72_009684 [Mortierella alpina]|nr:hypothetical protein BGZ72_009684 [Mortierella alpina]